MIDRYTTPAMSEIWSREAKYRRWLEVELAVCEAWAEEGVIAQEDLRTIRERAAFDLARCDEIEAETRHDLAAFVRCVEESVDGGRGDPHPPTPSPYPDSVETRGGGAGRWIHFGLTSYDVIDTALGMMLCDSCAVLFESLGKLSSAIEGLKSGAGATPMIGRTHGIHAEPITFGHKLAGWLAELDRAETRLRFCADDVAVGKVSGAVGVHPHVSPEMERRICERLGLRPDLVSTQIVGRDRLASLLCVLAVLAGSLERIATELRSLQRTEIREVEEGFGAGQKGSSSMPHKRNPWSSETVCGLARLVRANAHAMLETIATWHERDLTNSSLERVILPDTFHAVDFMLNRLASIVSNLQVLPENMTKNLRLMGDLVFSEHLMNSLIAKGSSRDEAYRIAQRNAEKAWGGADFRACVESDAAVCERLSEEEIARVFDLEHHLRHAERD